MKYYSTRNSSQGVSAAQAIAQGICENGGLFVPENFPTISEEQIKAMYHESYVQRASRILSCFLSDFTEEETEACVRGAYTESKFSGSSPAPLKALADGTYLLELWHGPTCAFKDMALQLLPHLLTRSLKKIGTDKEAMILVATSGDTGKAALEGFRDVNGTRILVFYPQNGVSSMQKRQMCTQEGENVSVCAVEGNFDDAQTGVKKIFTDASIAGQLSCKGIMLSSANSINWGRLLPQIVYYFSAYCDLAVSGTVKYPEKVNFAVPTGNFGNILAAYYAKRMGLPVGKLICASNSNNVLTDFIRTGVYDRNRKFYATISPSMDILISSNLERLLYDLTDRDAEKVSGWMNHLSTAGAYRVEELIKHRIQENFYAGFCSDADTKKEIGNIFKERSYLCDPHTAVAMNVCRRYREETGDRTPAVIVSTASPYKFAPDVLDALGAELPAGADEFAAVRSLADLTGTTVPEPIAALQSKALRFRDVCSKDKMSSVVLRFAEKK